MSDLTSLIRYFRYQNYSIFGVDPKTKGNAPCPHYRGNDQCQQPEKCYCRRLADVRGHIEHIIPPEYIEKNFNLVRGVVKTRSGEEVKVWNPKTAIEVKTALSTYLFGSNDSSKATSREDFNKISKMDQRFSEGANLIIHGSPFRVKKEGLPSSQSLPTGKTLIACVVLKEAIWRRLYATNRADTYAFVSYQTLRQDLKMKTVKSYDLKEFDWLAIDDINLPKNENDFEHQRFLTLFDDFLMTRIENRLPTILCCDFNVLSSNYSDQLGYSFQKMISLKNTHLIKAGE